MARAQKCGGVQKKISRNRTTGGHANELVTADQPTRTGTAPAAPPITMFWVVVRFSHNVYTKT